ncbi:unnamed protein product, partial [Discosporangium mesarthrocarpum]
TCSQQVLAVLESLVDVACFDDTRQLSGMSAITAHKTLHQFYCAFMQDMHDKRIFMREGEELHKMMRAYQCLGFPDAVGSTDVTHVQWDIAPYMEAVRYNGEEGFPSM